MRSSDRSSGSSDSQQGGRGGGGGGGGIRAAGSGNAGVVGASCSVPGRRTLPDSFPGGAVHTSSVGRSGVDVDYHEDGDDAAAGDDGGASSAEWDAEAAQSLSVEQWLAVFLHDRRNKKLGRVVGTEIFNSVLDQSASHRVGFPEFCQLCALYEIRIYSQPSFKQ